MGLDRVLAAAAIGDVIALAAKDLVAPVQAKAHVIAFAQLERVIFRPANGFVIAAVAIENDPGICGQRAGRFAPGAEPQRLPGARQGVLDRRPVISRRDAQILWCLIARAPGHAAILPRGERGGLYRIPINFIADAQFHRACVH